MSFRHDLYSNLTFNSIYYYITLFCWFLGNCSLGLVFFLVVVGWFGRWMYMNSNSKKYSGGLLALHYEWKLFFSPILDSLSSLSTLLSIGFLHFMKRKGREREKQHIVLMCSYRDSKTRLFITCKLEKLFLSFGLIIIILTG